jgi:hypothetical protein
MASPWEGVVNFCVRRVREVVLRMVLWKEEEMSGR